jgi:hypothetical protein
MSESDNILPLRPKSDTTAGPARLAAGHARRQREQEEYKARQAAKTVEALGELLERYRLHYKEGDRIALLQAQYLCYRCGRDAPPWVDFAYFEAVGAWLDAQPDPDTHKRLPLDKFMLGDRTPGSRHFTTAAADLHRKQAIVEAVELAGLYGIGGERKYDWARTLLQAYDSAYGIAANYGTASIKTIYHECKSRERYRNRQIAASLRAVSRSLPAASQSLPQLP